MTYVHNKTGGSYHKLATGVVFDGQDLVDYAPFVAYRTIRREEVIVCHRARYAHDELNMIIHEGRMQTEVTLLPGDEVVIYQSKADSNKWCRPTSEWEVKFTNMGTLP